MDQIFIITTIVFVAFLFFAYFLKVLKLSIPLILIYLVFCFSYVINQDFINENSTESIDKHIVSNFNSKNSINTIKDKNIEKSSEESKLDYQEKKSIDISKPIVSFNPKPIIIDSNLLIQKDKEKKIPTKSNLNVDNTNISLEKDKYSQNTLKLNEIMICRGIYKRNPIKPGFNFTNNVDSLFCYTKITNSGDKQEIKHVWYYQNQLVTSVVYNIKTSYNYRSWSKKNIMSSQIGKWRVDIVDNKDKILGSSSFEISSLNEIY